MSAPVTTPGITVEPIADPDVARLLEAGFGPDQIAILETLRAEYPLCEYLSREERDRLAFVRWRHTRTSLA
jgi:hypothetical protein